MHYYYALWTHPLKKIVSKLLFLGGGGASALPSTWWSMANNQCHQCARSAQSFCPISTMLSVIWVSSESMYDVVCDVLLCPNIHNFQTTIAIVFYHINSPKPAVDPDIKPAKDTEEPLSKGMNFRSNAAELERDQFGTIKDVSWGSAISHPFSSSGAWRQLWSVTKSPPE